MKRNEEEFDQILNSLDGIRRAKAPEGFRTGLDGRLAFVRQDRFYTIFKYGIAAMITLALLNGIVLVKQTTSQSEITDEEISAITETYSLENSIDYGSIN